jgi:ferredoxin
MSKTSFQDDYLTFMKVKVNKKKCLGCGVCDSLCPEVFKLKNGKSQVKEKANLKKHKDCIKQAIETCPVQAVIKIKN